MINLSRMRTLISYERRLKFRYQKKLAKATQITAQLTGLPRATGNRSQVESGAIDLAEVEEAYREIFEELENMRKELEELILHLDNIDDRGIMRLRYIDGCELRDIPGAVNVSERTMFYHLSGAERKLISMFPDRVRR